MFSVLVVVALKRYRISNRFFINLNLTSSNHMLSVVARWKASSGVSKAILSIAGATTVKVLHIVLLLLRSRGYSI